jgi:hypothetical protein
MADDTLIYPNAENRRCWPCIYHVTSDFDGPLAAILFLFSLTAPYNDFKSIMD